MIDLHIHSTYSDGAHTVKELIDILNKNNIKYASITDHNSIEAHLEYEANNYDKLYNGTMLRGTEIQTIVDGYLIELLVYNYDIKGFKEYIDNTRKKFWDFHNNAYQELLNKASKLGLKYTEPDRPIENGYYCNMKFQDAISPHVDYNKNIIDERVITDHLYFYRHEFQNPDSIFFVDNTKAFPKLKELIEVSHQHNGIVFIAHIDEYQVIPDKIEFLNKIIKEYKIDGIECFHPAINEENRKKYIRFARENNLLISAGSDFHGDHLPHRKTIKTEATFAEVNWLEK